MRRKDKEITDESEIESIIRNSLVCRLGLADNSTPYIVPLCFGYKDNRLYFHSAKEGRKIEILKRNNEVCFEFDDNLEVKAGKAACDWGMNFQEVTTHWAAPGWHQPGTVLGVAINKKSWDKLSAKHQQIIMDVAERARRLELTKTAEAGIAARKFLVEKGVKFSAFPAAELADGKKQIRTLRRLD